MSDKKYFCKHCNYFTDRRQYWYAHIKGKKHIKKMEESNENNKDNSDDNLSDNLSDNYHSKLSSFDNNDNFIDNKNDNKDNNKQFKKFQCNFCQQYFSQASNLSRHRKTCKLKYTIKKSGLYCMWNYKMVDENSNNYYKLGRTSSRNKRISSYASEYNVKVSDIQFLYEVEFEHEIFAEKFLFYFLDEYRMHKNKELFKVDIDTIKMTMNKLKIILDENPKINDHSIILDNFNDLMDENIDILNDEEEKENKKYLKSLLNGDYETLVNIKKLDNQLKPLKCEYCHKSLSKKSHLTRHYQTCKFKKEIEKKKELEKKLEQEQLKLEEEQIKLEEECKLKIQRKLVEEKQELERKLEEQLKLEEEKKELERKLEEQRKLEEERRLNELRKLEEKQQEEEKRLQEEKRQSEQKELINFLLEQHKRQDEERRLEKEEQRKREEKQAEENRRREDKLMELFMNSQKNNGYTENNELKEEIEELKQLIKENKPLDQSHNTNNSGTYFEAQTQNNLLNTLNLNYNNVISMNQFLYNMEHVNKIPRSDLEAIAFAQKNLSEADLAETIHKTIEKNCIEQTKGVINPADGLELLPVMPVVCSDGNCRSHKEKVNEFWETVYGDKHFDKMLNIIDKRIYEVLKKKIYLEAYGKKQLFKKIKRKHTVHDMKSMQEKINGELIGKKFKEI